MNKGLRYKPKREKEVELVWTAVLFDVTIVFASVYLTIIKDNASFLWLLLIAGCSGKLYHIRKNENQSENESGRSKKNCKYLFSDWCHNDKQDVQEKCGWYCYGKQEDCPDFEERK